MNLGFEFFFTSIMLGVGLAMDAFSVSLAIFPMINVVSISLLFLVVVLFFNYAAKVLLFFDMCKFLVQKNVFFASFFQYRTHERKNAT